MFDSILLSQLVWMFTIYSFAGWVLEVGLYTYRDKRWHNRGFLYGPFCPIYGIGFISVIAILSPLKYNPFLFFIGATIITTTVEYLTGTILELLFHTQWWDYSNVKYNLDGKICLKFSLAWGVVCTLVIYFIHPFISHLAIFLSFRFTGFTTSIILAYFILDSILTLVSLYGLKQFLENFESLRRQYDIDIADVRKNHFLPFGRLRKLKKQFNFNQKKLFSNLKERYIWLMKAFPELKSNRYLSLKYIRQYVYSKAKSITRSNNSE
jgi:uncharacterized membrane protein